MSINFNRGFSSIASWIDKYSTTQTSLVLLYLIDKNKIVPLSNLANNIKYIYLNNKNELLAANEILGV